MSELDFSVFGNTNAELLRKTYNLYSGIAGVPLGADPVGTLVVLLDFFKVKERSAH